MNIEKLLKLAAKIVEFLTHVCIILLGKLISGILLTIGTGIPTQHRACLQDKFANCCPDLAIVAVDDVLQNLPPDIVA